MVAINNNNRLILEINGPMIAQTFVVGINF